MQGRVNGIFWEESGPAEGVPLVFIHAFPLDRTMWDAQVRAFEGAFRVVRFDLRGFGRSDAGDGQYTIELYTDDLFALMDDRKTGPAVVCGLSMGGYVALRAAQREPARFRALVLADTKSEADTDEAKIKRHAAMLAVKKHPAVFAESFLKTALSEKTVAGRREVTEPLKELIAKGNPLGMAGGVLALAARTDTTAALAGMKMPVLVLVGEEDKITPPAAAEAMKKLLPDSELRRIPGAAHLSNLENPEAFNRALAEFLARIKK